MARWTCQRVTAGQKCGFTNEATRKLCFNCAKPRPKKRKPAHTKALDLPYSEYLQINGGIERCGICGAEPGSRRLHRDHDHRTGLPVGLLCFRCNSALRPYMDRHWLDAAAEYLRSAPERRRLAGVIPETPAAKKAA